MAKGAKKSLAGALARHAHTQEMKAKQKAAEEARERQAMAVQASQNGIKKKNTNKGSKPAQYASSEKQADDSENPGTIQDASPRAAGKRRMIEPFDKDDTILLVGEGNFSFALSLLQPPHNHPPHQVLATAYDSEADCYAKYPDAKDIVAHIRQLAGRDDIVAFGVDAGNLSAHKSVTGTGSRERKRPLRMVTGDPEEDMLRTRDQSETRTRRWSKIWFGFPHVGAGHKDETRNVLANQLLVARFILSAAPLLTHGPLPEYAREARKAVPKGSEDDDDSEREEGAEQRAEEKALEEGREGATELFHPSPSQGAMPFRPPNKAGSLLITVRNAHPYTLWNVPTLAKRLGAMLGPIAQGAPPLPKGVPRPRAETVRKVLGGEGMRLWRSYEFDPLAWPRYAHRRTVGWVEGISTSHNEDLIGRTKLHAAAHPGRSGKKHEGTGECRTYQFGLVFMDPHARSRTRGAQSKRRRTT